MENPFRLEPHQTGFESLAQHDGFKFWWASDLARLLGYEGLDTFRKAINKCKACGKRGPNYARGMERPPKFCPFCGSEREQK